MRAVLQLLYAGATAVAGDPTSSGCATGPGAGPDVGLELVLSQAMVPDLLLELAPVLRLTLALHC